MFPARENLWILSGNKALAGIKRSIGRKDIGSEHTLSEALCSLDKMFEYVVVDTSPSWDTLTINALFYCLEVLSPVSLEALTLNGLVLFSERLKSVQKFHPSLQHRYILPTFWDRRVKKSSEILEQLKKHYPMQVCDPIKYSVRISEAAGFGKTVYEYSPLSQGSKDYQEFIKRVLHER